MQLRYSDSMIQEALAEARLALAAGEVPVGCVFVSESGTVVARGRNNTHASGDATAHAEVVALRALAAQSKTTTEAFSLTLFVTCEPCIMCAAAVVQTRLVRAIVFGCVNPRFGGCGSVRSLDIHGKEIPHVTRGICESECLDLLVRFYETQNPYAPVPKKRRKRKRDLDEKDIEKGANDKVDN